MAADSEVLRQFLVSLGFSVDKISQAKFDKSVEKTDKTVKLLAGAFVGAGLAAQALVARYADSFEKLYYLSQRTGTSANDIKAAASAGRQIGLSAEALESTINTLSQKLKQPGMTEFVAGITGKAVAGRPVTEVLTNFIEAFRNKPDWLGINFAEQLGLDPDTYLQLKNNFDEFKKSQQQYQQQLKDNNLDLDEQAKTLKEYNQTLKHLGDQMELVGVKAAKYLLPVFRNIASVVGFSLEQLSTFLDKLNQDNGKSTGEVIEDTVFSPLDLAMGVGADIHDYLFGKKYEGPAGPRMRGGFVTDEPSKAGAAPVKTRGARNNNPGNIKYGNFARGQGATGQDADGFAIFPSLQAGTSALQQLVGKYLTGGRDTIDSFINNYSTTDQDAYKRFLSQRLGKGRFDKLTSSDTSALVSGLGMFDSQFDPLAVSGITLNQTNNINIDGASDPQTTGRVVLDTQRRVNADLARNLKGATR